MREYLEEMKRIVELEKQLKQMQDEFKKMDQNLTNFRGQVKSKQIAKTKKYRMKQVAREEGKVNAMKTQIDNLRAEIETKSQKVYTEMKNETDRILDGYWDSEDKENRISDIEQELRVREFEAQKSSKIADLEKEVRVREQEIQKAERIRDLEKKIENRKKAIPKNEQAIKDAEETIKYLESEIEESSKRLISNPSQNKLYTNQIKKNAKNLEENRTIIQGRRKQNKEQARQISELERQLEEVKAQKILGEHVPTYSYLEYDELISRLEVAKTEVSTDEHVLEFESFDNEQLEVELQKVQGIKVIDDENVDFIETVEAMNKQVKSAGFNSEKESIISALERISEEMPQVEKAEIEEAARKAAEEAAKKVAEEEAAKKAAEKEVAKKVAEEEAAKRAAEEEAAKKAAEEEAAKKAAEEAAKKAAEEEAAKKAAEEEAAKRAAEEEAARKAAEEAAKKAAEEAARKEEEEVAEEEIADKDAIRNASEKIEAEKREYIFAMPWSFASEKQKQTIIADVLVGDRIEDLDDKALDDIIDIIKYKYNYLITMDELKEAIGKRKTPEKVEESVLEPEEYEEEYKLKKEIYENIVAKCSPAMLEMMDYLYQKRLFNGISDEECIENLEDTRKMKIENIRQQVCSRLGESVSYEALAENITHVDWTIRSKGKLSCFDLENEEYLRMIENAYEDYREDLEELLKDEMIAKSKSYIDERYIYESLEYDKFEKWMEIKADVMKKNGLGSLYVGKFLYKIKEMKIREEVIKESAEASINGENLVEELKRIIEEENGGAQQVKFEGVEELFENDVGRARNSETGELPPETGNSDPLPSFVEKESMVDKIVDGITGIPSAIGISKLGEMIAAVLKGAWRGWKKVTNKLLNVLKIKDDIDEYDDDFEEDYEEPKKTSRFLMWMEKMADALTLDDEDDCLDAEYEKVDDKMAEYTVYNSGNKLENEAKKKMAGKTERANEKTQRTHTD